MIIPTLYIITTALIIGYITLMIYSNAGWRKIKSQIQHSPSADLKLSIVVPFRDEEENLPAFLESIKIQQYNKLNYELIMVDDHSSDNGPEIVTEFIGKNDLSVILYRLEESDQSKKKAIEKGVEQATGEIIITTDADTNRSEKWLQSIALHFVSDKIELLIAPVRLTGSTFIQQFQTLEFYALQYITMSFAAQHNAVLCNGANMAYRKGFFNRVHGFKSNEGISSGDDIFLLFQLKKDNNDAIAYTVDNDAMVNTEAETGIMALMNQKIRWASKSIHITNSSFLLLSLLAAASNIWLLCLFALERNVQSWPFVSLLFLTVKCIFDFVMIRRISTRYNARITIGSFLLSFILYPFYLIGVFLLSTFKPATWKGRVVHT